MKNKKMMLSPIWYMSHPIDFEMKQYILLDYLQKVERGFRANNLADFLHEARFHSKGIECFLTIRSLLELRDFPAPTDEQREYFKMITGKPDDDPKLMEAVKIGKWALTKLQDVVKTGSEIFKKIEGSIKMY